MAKMKKTWGESARRAGEATASAIRKLFGGQPSTSGSNSDSGRSSSHDQRSIHDGNKDCEIANPSSNFVQKAETPSSKLPEPSASTSNSSKEPNTPTAHIDGNMPAVQSSSRHSGSANASVAKENNAGSHDGQHTSPPLGEDSKADGLASSMNGLSLGQTAESSVPEAGHAGENGSAAQAPQEEELTEEEKAFRAERAKHLVFIEEALDMARLALKTNETPVGCVLVHNDKVIARGMNATNVTRNGTRHAELMAICALLSYAPKGAAKTTCLKPRMEKTSDDDASDNGSAFSVPQPDEGNEDGRKGHLYPYGQKEHPDERVDRAIIRECILYVTVEPCVMCASMLRQLGIKKVFFGAVNDKFGGTGGVFSIHANSLPVRDDGQTASAHPQPPPMRLPNGKEVLGTSFPPSGGDGGNVEPGYEIEGGWGRDEAVGLLRRFYVQENGRAPVPRKKEGRAARLAALEGTDGESLHSNSGSA